jgi:DNA-binding NarL/FixJ family response regulator
MIKSDMLNQSQDNPYFPSAIRVVIIEDQQEIREGLRNILDASPGYSCLATYETMELANLGIRALMKSPDERPSVILIDLGLPGMSGTEGISILKREFPDLLFIVLSVFMDDKRIFDALCAGATGYLLKKTPPMEILTSVREVVEGGAPMSPEVARRVVELFQHLRPPQTEVYDLTPHEQRVLKLLVEGHIYKTAAVELKVTVHAVSFHVRKIYEKLQVHSKTEAVAKALKHNLV